MDSTFFLVVAILAIAAQGLLFLGALFEPLLRYKVSDPPKMPLNSGEFQRLMELLCDAHLHPKSRIEELMPWAFQKTSSRAA